MSPGIWLSESQVWCCLMKSRIIHLVPWSNHIDNVLNRAQEVILFRSQMRKYSQGWEGENFFSMESRGEG